MPVTKEYLYYGTNPVIRVGGDNTMSAMDSEVTGNGRGRISGAGWKIGKVDQFGGSVGWNVRSKHFVERSTRAALDAFINRQRTDLWNRNQRRPHDLFHSYRPGDYEWVALAPEATDVDSESVAPAYLVTSGSSSQEIVLGDLSYWSQDEDKFPGGWTLYNDTQAGSYSHAVPTSSTHADMSASSTFTFMGWIKSTGTGGATHHIFRKQGNYVFAISSSTFRFTWRGATQVNFSTYTFPLANNRWYFVAITITGTTINLYVAGDWETSLTNVASTIGGAIGGNNSNPLYIGSDDGDDSFIGYLGPMVFTNTLVSAANVEAQFDLTKNGQVMFSDIADSIYGSPTKALFYDMRRRREFESLTNLMLTKQYNVFAGNSTPTDGAIQLDHSTRIANIDSLFVDTALRDGLGDRLFLGPLDDFTDDLGYSDDSEVVWVRRKEIARSPVTVYDDRRIEIKPSALPRNPPEGFRASHNNGQSLIIKFAERYPLCVPDEILAEQVSGLQRGRMREIEYSFLSERFPYHDIDAQNYDDAFDLQYSAFPP